MRVLFIIPPYPIKEYPALSTGTMYLAAVLLQEGYVVNVLDLLVSEASRSKVRETLERFRPEVVGVTSVTMTFPMAQKILRWTQECLPESVRVLGGPHVTFAAKRSLLECPSAHIVVRGEAEVTIQELLQAMRADVALSTVRGITFRRGDEIVSTPDRPLVEDLDGLPFPAWHTLPLARYRALHAKVGVLSSRGCPYGCIFCVGHRMVGRKGRFRTPSRVVDEMEWLAHCGFSSVGIDDDLFTLDHKHAASVCEEIKRRRSTFTWYAFARVDTVTPDLLHTMKDAGCTDICYGVESGSQAILNRIGKRITLDQVRRAVKMGEEAGIRILASFILGLPGETRETLSETAAFARSLGCRYGYHVLAPFPGTRVRDEADHFDIRILTDQWDLYDADRPVCLTPSIEPKDIRAVLDRYDRDLKVYCDNQENRVRLGLAHPQEVEEVGLRHHRILAWEILRRDMIEKKGMLRRKTAREEALPRLIDGLCSEVDAPRDRLQKLCSSWVRDGLLRCEFTLDGCRWRWATTDEILHPEKAPAEAAL